MDSLYCAAILDGWCGRPGLLEPKTEGSHLFLLRKHNDISNCACGWGCGFHRRMKPLTIADLFHIILGLQEEIRRSEESRFTIVVSMECCW
jgi:hypothetical protein